jgi:hypothetical protein|tara:strand:+ start:282 stop:512 length:231 start_codon:yes stop_codon:yes gene_type:complete
MGKMSWISYLCESGNREELIKEVGSVEIADNFLNAHNQMRENREKPAYKELNKIHDKMQREVHDAKVSSVRVQSKK